MTSGRTPGTGRWQIATLLVIVAIVAFAVGYLASSNKHAPNPPPTVAGFIWPPPPPLTTFILSDSQGESFSEAQLDDQWTLIFFGYTHCPDICPTTMQTLSGVREQLTGHQAFERRGQVLFVSVDAERDTPELLRKYVGHFNPDFKAATAAAADLHRLTGQFGVQIVRVSGSKPDEYWFDHPASILLIGPDRRLTGVFAPPLDASDIARQVRAIVDWQESNS